MVNKHGLSKLPEYKHWTGMINRCENPGATRFEHYGGRGIKICERWRENFKNFYEDMGPRPAPGYSVDRIDTNGDYEPNNCRWATPMEQSRNTRANRLVSVGGHTITLAEAIEKSPVAYKTALRRIIRGWDPVDAVTLPVQKRPRQLKLRST